MSRVRRWHFNPALQTSDEAVAWLVRSPNLVLEMHAVALDGFVLVRVAADAPAIDGAVELSVDAVRIQRFCIRDIEPSFFLSAVALGEALDGIGSRIAQEARLREFHGWDVMMEQAGTTFVTDMVVDGISCFVTTRKTDSHFFDFVLYSRDGVATFQHKSSVGGFQHSGDIGSLLHFVSTTDALPIGETYALAVVGYQSRALRLFMQQLPAVCIPCRENGVVRIVPCPLDELTIGNNTMAVLMTVTREAGGKLRWAVMTTPPAAVGIDTNDLNGSTSRCFREALEDAARVVAAASAAAPNRVAPPSSQQTTAVPSTVEQPPLQPVTPASPAAVITAVQQIASRYPAVAMIEAGLTPQLSSIPTAARTSTLVAMFGCHVSLLPATEATTHQPTTTSMSPVVLTLAACGTLSGAAAVALGGAFQPNTASTGLRNAEDYHTVLTHAVVRVVHCSDGMLEQVAGTPSEAVNAIFIIHPQRSLSRVPTIPGQSELEAMLSDVNVTAVTAMAGPLSIVVVQLPSDGRRYFYRGVAWPGLLDTVPNFGTDVTASLSDERLFRAATPCTTTITTTTATTTPRKTAAVSSGGHWMPPALYDRSKGAPVLFADTDGQLTEASEAVKRVCGMGRDELLAQRRVITRLLSQLQAVLSPAALEPAVRLMAGRVHELVTTASDAAAARFNAAVKARASAETIAEAGAALSLAKANASSGLQWLIDILGACMSVKGSAMRRHDLNRLRRKMDISVNVEAAKSMSADQICALLESSCHEHNACLIVHVRPDALQRCIHAVSPVMTKHTYNATVHTLPPMVTLSPRLLCIDALTVGALQENAKFANATALTPIKKDAVSLAFVGADAAPALPLPLLKRYVDMTDPTEVDWLEACNESTVARLRILLRGTLSMSAATRDHQVPPQARDLGYALVDLLLQSVEEAVKLSGRGEGSTTQQPSAVLHFEDTTSQVARGVLGLVLTTLASSARPISKAWQLTRRAPQGTPGWPEQPEPEQWWMYARLASVYPYTCWPQESFVANVRVIAVHLLRRYVVEALTGPLCAAAPEAVKANAMASTPTTAASSGAAVLKSMTTNAAATVKPAPNAQQRQAGEFGFVDLTHHVLEATASTPTAAAITGVASRMVERIPFEDDVRRGGPVTLYSRCCAFWRRLQKASSGDALRTTDR